jgi:hypothetical protein
VYIKVSVMHTIFTWVSYFECKLFIMCIMYCLLRTYVSIAGACGKIALRFLLGCYVCTLLRLTAYCRVGLCEYLWGL